MKKSNNKKEAEPSENRENIELLTKNEIKIDKQVITGNVINYNISVENLVTAEEDETRNKKKKSCLERLKEIHVAFKILAVLLGIIITLSPFIPKIIDGTRVETSTTANTTITTATKMPTATMTMKKSDVFILVIPSFIDGSYLQSGDESSRISATINAQENGYASGAAHALVNGKLHVFGGWSDGNKIARLDGCSLKELPARLNEEREYGPAAVSLENGRKALVCFGGDTRRSCEIFDGSSASLTFAAEWTHRLGGLGLFNNQPATVGCDYAEHQKAETLSATGWIPLPDHPLKISAHSLVGLENGAMLLLGGVDWTKFASDQTGIWQLKEDQWSRIGDFSKPACSGSAIYLSRSVYYFEGFNSAIYLVDLDENEELEAVEEIGRQPEKYLFPVLFQTDNDYCT